MYIILCIVASYVDGITIPRGFPGTPVIPTAHEVSEAIFNVEQTNTGNDNELAVAFMTIGQFLDHDVTEVPVLSCQLAKFGE